MIPGGAKCREFCPETLESKLAPGLYACGELFDVTGPCGGYNLAWAWASGCLAGKECGEAAVNGMRVRIGRIPAVRRRRCERRDVGAFGRTAAVHR